MFTLLRRAELRAEFLTEAPSLALSMLAAELFYKFHSFTLECIAFLATWGLLGWLLSLVQDAWSARRAVS